MTRADECSIKDLDRRQFRPSGTRSILPLRKPALNAQEMVRRAERAATSLGFAPSRCCTHTFGVKGLVCSAVARLFCDRRGENQCFACCSSAVRGKFPNLEIEQWVFVLCVVHLIADTRLCREVVNMHRSRPHWQIDPSIYVRAYMED